jgi:anti-anti-sigma factor
MAKLEEKAAIVTGSPVRALFPGLEDARCVPLIEISIDEAPGEVLVHIAGQASVDQVGPLSAMLLGVSSGRPSLVTLDLSGLTFISSLAMGALVTLCRGLVRAGTCMRLVPTLQEPVREALARAELLTLFGMPEETEVCESELFV